MSGRQRWFVVLPALIAAGACRPSCGQRAPHAGEDSRPYVSEVSEEPGAAVEILVDCSGSMNESWHGEWKARAARAALQEALDATREFRRAHPDRRIKVGVVAFNSGVQEVLPIQDWSGDGVTSALSRLPAPGGYTAIGEALDFARKQLYRSGSIRKYILAITDGENTKGRRPEEVARTIAARSRGAVSISLVAVDLDAARYRFIEQLGGDVLQANDPASLRAAVQKIYEGKILAEAVDAEAGTPAEAGEAAGPGKPSSASSSGSEP